MPTFYFSSLNQNWANSTLTIINRITIITLLFLSSFQSLQLQIARFCCLQSPSRNVVHSRASISPSNVQSFLLSKNCFVQHNMKQRGHVEILHGHNWIRKLEGYISLLPRIKRRVQRTAPFHKSTSRSTFPGAVKCREEIGNGYPISHNPLRGLCKLSLRVKVAHASFRLFDRSNFTRTDQKTNRCQFVALNYTMTAWNKTVVLPLLAVNMATYFNNFNLFVDP